MLLEQTRSAGQGLERSCQSDGSWIASARPSGGVELFRAWFAGKAYDTHRHDTYAVGLTDSGVQMFDYRGAGRASTAGQVVVLHPDEPHDGRAGTREGFGYRIVYVVPGPNSIQSRVVQLFYPYAKPVPLTYMKPGQTYWGTRRTVGGWFRSSTALTRALVQAGLPRR